MVLLQHPYELEMVQTELRELERQLKAQFVWSILQTLPILFRGREDSKFTMPASGAQFATILPTEAGAAIVQIMHGALLSLELSAAILV
jgi:hypothetical protein